VHHHRKIHGQFHGRFHGRGRWGGERGGHRWRGRVFEQGDLRLVILKLIADQPAHGYEIIKQIEDRLGGAYSPSPGVVYPTLTLLEETGLAQVEVEDSGKKRYSATDAGRAHLEAQAAQVHAAFARADGATGDRAAMLRVRRAMENLKTALRLKATQGALTEAQIDAIAAAIDGAANAVERA